MMFALPLLAGWLAPGPAGPLLAAQGKSGAAGAPPIIALDGADWDEPPRRSRSRARRPPAEPPAVSSSGGGGGAFFEEAAQWHPDDSPAAYLEAEDDDDDYASPAYVEPERPHAAQTEGYWGQLAQSPDRLRASDLNELLLPDHMERLRYQNNPMMMFGAHFKWDVLLEDTMGFHRAPWDVLAEAHELEAPDDDDVRRAMGMRPERAITTIFRWTDDWGFATQLGFEHSEAAATAFEGATFEAADGVGEWLALLNEYKVPCCVCSTLDLPSAEASMERAGLGGLFTGYVTAEDGCETAEEQYLLSCVKIGRPPTRCVVFEDDPQGLVAAHEATAKCVAVMSKAGSRGLEMRHADLRVPDLSDLNAMSLRNLFKDVEVR